MKRIVYTRHGDGGVTVCTPTDWAIGVMSCGGFWADKPRGYGDVQIERQIARGVQPDAARRYVMAMLSGGLTTAEAYAVIRDRDCAHLGYHMELMDYEELPDRWFRNAWRQGGNSRQIYVDLTLARPIQWQKAWDNVEAENLRRRSCFEEEKPPLDVDWQKLRTAVRHARDEEELRHVWPEELGGLEELRQRRIDLMAAAIRGSVPAISPAVRTGARARVMGS